MERGAIERRVDNYDREVDRENQRRVGERVG